MFIIGGSMCLVNLTGLLYGLNNRMYERNTESLILKCYKKHLVSLILLIREEMREDCTAYISFLHVQSQHEMNGLQGRMLDSFSCSRSSEHGFILFQLIQITDIPTFKGKYPKPKINVLGIISLWIIHASVSLHWSKYSRADCI